MVDEDDFAVVNRRKIERAFLGAEDLGHFGRQEVLQIIADGFADAAKLFCRLVEKTIFEMVLQRQRGAVFARRLFRNSNSSSSMVLLESKFSAPDKVTGRCNSASNSNA